jgi:hypothetical protein
VPVGHGLSTLRRAPISNASRGAGRLIERAPYAAKTKEGVYRHIIGNGGVKGTYAGEGL